MNGKNNLKQSKTPAMQIFIAVKISNKAIQFKQRQRCEL